MIAGAPRQQSAEIYYDWRPNVDAIWLVPAAALSALILTLGGVAWFLGRTLVQPLIATGQAARLVAGGQLDVSLPHSRVREVAELTAAFNAMSAELRASLRQQAALEEERRLFIGAIAHDLRTPLFSIRGYLEGLEQGLAATPERRAHYIHICREKADVLERLVSDLFAFTKLEYLQPAMQREPVALGALLRGLVDGRHPLAAAGGITLEVGERGGPWVVDGDAHLLERAIGNLLDNAIHYTPRGGVVEVSVGPSPESGRASVVIADSGPGIAPEHLPHVFEPFYRSDRDRAADGAGLGLAIARRILRAHGGDLTAANRDGSGAELCGWLPIARPPGAASLPPAE